VGINVVLMSLLYKKHPSQVKFVLIDPKKVELFPYARLENHFLTFLPDQLEPIVTDTTKVVHTLNSLIIEMETRYDLLKKAETRNIAEYNDKFVARRLNPNKGHRFLPYIVLIIDEFADLIMTAGKEVELPIGRLAQLARAVGIHLIIATQRPSVNIITGVIKANFPARIAFKVASKVDSRTILDAGGSEQLTGRGDMLLSVGGDIIRLQSAFVDTPEVERVIDFIANQQGFAEPFFLPEFHPDGEGGGGSKEISIKELDDMIDDAARLVVENQHGSTSMIQRRLKLGYNRAGRIMDQLESLGIVGPAEGSKPREVLYYDVMELERFLAELRARR
jgi:S-DNA-T family DNA segregation ATPase FtsK/SpoIIIE